MNTDDLKNSLTKAHVEYVLKQLSDSTIKETLKVEFKELWHYLKQIKVKEVFELEQTLRMVRKFGVENYIANQVHEVFCSGLQSMLFSPIHTSTKISEVFPTEEFVRNVETFVSWEKLRIDVIHVVLTSSVYHKLITDVLYQGIKGFLLEENFIAKMPGVSSFLKVGKWSLAKAMPNLETIVEKAAKSYIQDNIQKTIQLSEKSVKKSLEGSQLKELAEHMWCDIKNKPLNFASIYCDEEKVAEINGNLFSWWEHYRKTEHFIQLTEALISDWLKKVGELSIVEALENIGVNYENALDELLANAPKLLDLMQHQDYLRQRIQSHISSFYQSNCFKELIGSFFVAKKENAEVE